MKEIDLLLSTYGESHQNHTNKMIHWICVPAIMFSLVGLIMHIPFIIEITLFMNWASIVLLFALIYYLRLSLVMFLGFVVISFLLLYGNWKLMQYCTSQNCSSALTLVEIFIVAWIGQFIGHKIEGKKPSFLKDIQFLLIGPAWLLHFIYVKLGIRY
jgi:uncharacterized membrane protein YGL010W